MRKQDAPGAEQGGPAKPGPGQSGPAKPDGERRATEQPGGERAATEQPDGERAAPARPPGPGASARARAAWLVRGVVVAASAFAERTYVARTLDRLFEINIVDRAAALASKAFVALLPVIVVTGSIAPEGVRAGVAETVRDRFGITGQSLVVVRSALAPQGQVQESTSVFSVLFLVVYALTFTTSLLRVYQAAWRRPGEQGFAPHLRGLQWLAGLAALFSISAMTSLLLTGIAGEALTILIGFCVGVLLWWWTARAMLAYDIRWRPLLPGAVLTAAGLQIYGLTAVLWMPRTVTQNAQQLGFFGVAMALVSWFVGAAFILLTATAVGAVLAEDEGPVGRWLRRPTGTILEPGAPASLPALPRHQRLRRLNRRLRRLNQQGSGAAASPGTPHRT